MLLREAGVLYADETPARAAGTLHYVHVACTGFLTAMHTGDRAEEAIDAGGVLPGYAGTIVRDGYAGYDHLSGALRAWCGARGLRDLKGLHESGPQGQVWAKSMADLLIGANKKATAARAAGQASLPEDQLAEIPPGTTARSPRASPATRASAARPARTGCGWPAGSAATRT